MTAGGTDVRPGGWSKHLEKAMVYMSHRPNQEFTTTEIARATGTNPKKLLSALNGMAKRGYTGLRRVKEEDAGQFTPAKWVWVSNEQLYRRPDPSDRVTPDIVTVPPDIDSVFGDSVREPAQVEVEKEMAQSSRGLSRRVIEWLASRPDQSVTVKEMIAAFGGEFTNTQISSAANYAVSKVREVERLSYGVYQWNSEPSPTNVKGWELLAEKENALLYKDQDGNLWKCERIVW